MISIFLLIIVSIGVQQKKRQADIGVVLGTTVYKDGSLSPYLQARLDKAAQMYKEHYFSIVVVSGGYNSNGISEVEVMENYLVNLGVSKMAIRQDPNGINTAATAQNIKAIMQKENAKSVFIITQFFHLPRTRLAFSCHNIKHIYYAPSYYLKFGDVFSLLREIPANIVYGWNCLKL